MPHSVFMKGPQRSASALALPYTAPELVLKHRVFDSVDLAVTVIVPGTGSTAGSSSLRRIHAT